MVVFLNTRSHRIEPPPPLDDAPPNSLVQLLSIPRGCQLEVSGCTLDDMPCSAAAVAADAEADAAEDGATEDSSASAGGPPFWACRYGAGAFAAAAVTFLAAGL